MLRCYFLMGRNTNFIRNRFESDFISIR